MTPAPHTVTCPTCGRRVEWSPRNRWRPFCSERCRLIDLGAWLEGDHAIPGEPAPGDRTPRDPDSEPDDTGGT